MNKKDVIKKKLKISVLTFFIAIALIQFSSAVCFNDTYFNATGSGSQFYTNFDFCFDAVNVSSNQIQMWNLSYDNPDGEGDVSNISGYTHSAASTEINGSQFPYISSSLSNATLKKIISDLNYDFNASFILNVSGIVPENISYISNTSTYSKDYSRNEFNYYYNNNTIVLNILGIEIGTNNIYILNDTFIPNIAFINPTTNIGNLSQDYIAVNLSFSDSNLKNATIFLFDNNGLYDSQTSSESPYFINFTALPAGQYYLNATVYDYNNNENSTETLNIYLDNENPSASLNTPANNIFLNNPIINLTVNLLDNLGIKNASLYINDVLNNTITFANGITSSTIGFVVNLSDGIYTWFYNIFDWSNNYDISETRTLTIDTISPEINVLSPSNITYTNNTIYFNATSNEDISTWVVNYNGTNTTLSSINSSLYIANGNYHLFLYGNDSANNFGLNDSIYFSIDNSTPTITILSPTTNEIFIQDSPTAYLNISTNFNTSTCYWNNGSNNFTMSSLNSTYFYNSTAGLQLLDGNQSITFWCYKPSTEIWAQSENINFFIDSSNITTCRDLYTSREYEIPYNLNIPASNLLEDEDTEVDYCFRLLNDSISVNLNNYQLNIDGVADSETRFFYNKLSNNAVIKNGIIENISAIKVEENLDNISINNIVFNNNYVGIKLEDGLSNIIINNCSFDYQEYGALVINTNTEINNISLINSVINNSYYGITIDYNEYVNNLNISNNNFINNTRALELAYLTNAYIYNNNITNGPTNAEGIYAYSIYNSTINNNNILSGQYGIDLNTGNNIIINNNNINTTNYRIRLNTISDSNLNNNVFYANTYTSIYSLYLNNCDDNIFDILTSSGNSATNYYGIYLTESSNNNFTDYISSSNIGTSNRYDIYATSNSINNNFISSDFTYEYTSANSNFTRYWNYYTTVTDLLSNPLENANVNIKDVSSDEVFNDNTYVNGSTDSQLYAEYRHHQGSKLNYIPYNLTVSKVAYETNSTLFNITSDTSYTILLDESDNINPSVIIYKNETSLEYSINSINITWNATDNDVLVSSNFNITYPNGTILFESSDFTGEIILNPNNLSTIGFYNITLWAEDEKSNTNITTDQFEVVDTELPIIIINTPINTNYNNRTILLNLSATDNYNLDTIWFNWNGSNITYSSAINTLFDEGSNVLYAWVNDSSGNINSTVVTFFTDTIAPDLNIVHPTVTTYGGATLDLNYTVADSGIGLDTCWYANGTGEDNITITCGDNTTITQIEGTHTIYMWANDTLGNIASDSVTYQISLAAPVTILNDPNDDTYLSDGSNIVINFTSTDANGIGTCELWGNWSEGWHLNQTLNTIISGSKTSFNSISLSDGIYIWNVWCNDTLANGDFALNNYTFTVDEIYPQIDYGILTEETEVNKSQNNIYINTTWTEINFKNITFRANSNSQSYAIPTYAYNFTGLSDGIYIYNITICDLVNNCNTTENRQITLDTINPNITLQTPSNETRTNVVSQNLTANINDTNIKNYTLEVRNSSGTLINSTSNDISSTGNAGVIYTFTEGIFNWLYKAWDWAGNLFTSNENQIEIDLTSPYITIVSPENITYASTTIDLKVTSNSTDISSWWYSLNGGNNISFTPNSTITGKAGSNNIIVYSNDTLNNIRKTSKTFSIAYSDKLDLSLALNTTAAYAKTINLIATTVTNNTNISYCNFSLVSPSKNIFINTIGTSDNNFQNEIWTSSNYLINESGNYNYNVTCMNEVGGINSSSGTFNASYNLFYEPTDYNFAASVSSTEENNISVYMYDDTTLTIPYNISVNIDYQSNFTLTYPQTINLNNLDTYYAQTSFDVAVKANAGIAEGTYNGNITLLNTISGESSIINFTYGILPPAGIPQIKTTAEVICSRDTGNCDNTALSLQQRASTTINYRVTNIENYNLTNCSIKLSNTLNKNWVSKSPIFFNLTYLETKDIGITLQPLDTTPTTTYEGFVYIYCSSGNLLGNSVESAISNRPYLRLQVSSRPDTGATGGGGSIIIISEDGNESSSWSMTTQERGTTYNINLLEDTQRTKNLLFKNLGTSSRPITLSCENVEGDLCSYVTFAEKFFNIPLVQNLEISKSFTVYAPSNIEFDKYVFNIVATDDSKNRGIITVTANTDLNPLVEVGTKLISWKRFSENFTFPYLLLFVFIWAISSLLIKLIFLLKVNGGFAIAVILGLLLSLIVIFFL